MRAKVKAVGNYEDLLRAVLNGAVRLINISPLIRIKDRTFYIYALRYYRGMRNKEMYAQTLKLIEEDILLINDEEKKESMKRLIECYKNMMVYIK